MTPDQAAELARLFRWQAIAFRVLLVLVAIDVVLTVVRLFR